MPGKTEVQISMNPQFLKAVQNAVKAGTRDCFKQIRQMARDRSPRDTGDNAHSIGTRVKSSPGRVSASIYTQSGYGGYLERGTSKMAARPYILPAVDEGLTQLPGMVAARLEEFSQGNVTEIPDEVIQEAVSRIKTKRAKGVGIIGGSKYRLSAGSKGGTRARSRRLLTNRQALWQRYVNADPRTRGDWIDYMKRGGR